MTISMYQVSAPVFVQGLKGLRGVLAKGAAHAEEAGASAVPRGPVIPVP